jgi:hypothetical protein
MRYYSSNSWQEKYLEMEFPSIQQYNYFIGTAQIG